MPIVRAPDHSTLNDQVHCTVCQQTVRISEATAGAYDNTGQTLFACSSHVAHDAHWLRAWALHLLRFLEPHAVEKQVPEKGNGLLR